MSELHTVFGASGALGSAIVHHLHAEGLPIRAVARNIEHATDVLPEGIDIVQCDATDGTSVMAAAHETSVIYNCMYVGDQMKEVAGNLMAAARETGARLVNPSNALVYGPLQTVPATEEHPQKPTSRRGIVRKEIDNMLMEAHDKGEIQVVIPRLATFYGAHVTGTFMAAVFESANAGRKAMWFGRLDQPHDLVYLPDAAAACVLLATNDAAYGQAWHVPGAGPMMGGEFITQVYKTFDKPAKMSTRGKTFFQLAGIVAPRILDMVEVMYQFEQPFVLDGSKFTQAYQDFKYTPHDIGISDTVEWYKAFFDNQS
jgi:nucleoside-diphosphate-sugar epimerase